MRKTLIATALLVASFSASLAQTPERYSPGPPKDQKEAPAKVEQAPKRDYQAESRKRVATWQETKVECYRTTGAQEGKHWRVNPDNAGDIQTHSSMWDLAPGIQAKVAECKAK